MRLIDADELKQHKVYSEERHEYVVPVYNIDNAPTVKEVSIIEFKEPLPEVKAVRIVKALQKKMEEGEEE